MLSVSVPMRFRFDILIEFKKLERIQNLITHEPIDILRKNN